MSFFDFFWEKSVAVSGGEDTEVFWFFLATVAAAAAVVAAATAGVATGAVAAPVATTAVATAGVATGAVAAAVATAAVAAVATAAVATGVLAAVAVGLFYSFLFFPPLIPFLIASFVLAEAFFWKSKRKPKKSENTFWFTTKLKAFYLFESCFWILQVNGWFYALKGFLDWFGLNQETIQQAIYFVGWGTATIIVIMLIGFVWIKTNQLKYRKKTTEKVRRSND
jgi:hypothetical protein